MFGLRAGGSDVACPQRRTPPTQKQAMTHDRRPDRLRVDIPTLEPDDAFVGRLAHLSAASRPVHPRSTRSAGLRMVIAGGSVAVIATAAWAAGIPTGWETPLSPADSPTQHVPAPAPGPGDVGTPHSDVSNSPGSPLSPGLPGVPHSSPSNAKPTGPKGHAVGKSTSKHKKKHDEGANSDTRDDKPGKKNDDGSGNHGVGPSGSGNNGVGPKNSPPKGGDNNDVGSNSSGDDGNDNGSSVGSGDRTGLKVDSNIATLPPATPPTTNNGNGHGNGKPH